MHSPDERVSLVSITSQQVPCYGAVGGGELPAVAGPPAAAAGGTRPQPHQYHQDHHLAVGALPPAGLAGGTGSITHAETGSYAHTPSACSIRAHGVVTPLHFPMTMSLATAAAVAGHGNGSFGAAAGAFSLDGVFRTPTPPSTGHQPPGGHAPLPALVLPPAAAAAHLRGTGAVVVVEALDGSASLWDIARALIPVAIPGAVSICAVFALSSIALAFCGSYLGPQPLAGASLGFFLLAIAGWYPGSGLCFAVDTLCSQEFGRDPDSDVLGEVTQRSMLISAVFWVPSSLLLWHLPALLGGMYDAAMLQHAAEFLRWAPLYLLPALWFTSLAKFCSNQFLVNLPMYGLVASCCVLPLAERVLVPRLGVAGASIGLAVAGWAQLAALSLLIYRHSDARRRFGSFSLRRVLQRDAMVEFFRLGVPSVLFVWAESSAFDMTLFLAAYLGPQQTAAWTAVLQTCLLLTALPSGLSVAATAHVGSALGANRPKDAKKVALTAALLAFAIGLVNAALLLRCHRWLFSWFTTDQHVLRLTASLMGVVPILHLCDDVQFVFQGIFSGAGQNHLGATALLGTLWAVGMTAAFAFTLVLGWNLFGVAAGLCLGLVVECPVLITLCLGRFDWAALADEASHPAGECRADHLEEFADPEVPHCRGPAV